MVKLLDNKYKILWLNDSAISNGWMHSSEDSDIKNQFNPETNNELLELLQDCVNSESTITKRNFKLIKPNEKHRIDDLTVSWSNTDNILIIDFGSQFTQLIARRVREEGVFCQILPYNKVSEYLNNNSPKGIILSGGPSSVLGIETPRIPKEIIEMGKPILVICYGQQVLVQQLGGKVI